MCPTLIFNILSPIQSIPKAYLRDKPEAQDVVTFKNAMQELLTRINPNEHEEFNKNLVAHKVSTLCEQGELEVSIASLSEIVTNGILHRSYVIVPIMARLLEIEEKELLTIWLADKVLDTVEGEDEVKRDAVISAQKEIEAGFG
jgi:hypothetical protein